MFLSSDKGLSLEERLFLLVYDVHVVCSWKRALLGLPQLSTQFFNNCRIKMKWKGWRVRITAMTWPADLKEFPQIVYQI